MLTSSDDTHFPTGTELTQQLRAAGITVFKPTAFAHFQEELLGQVKKSGIRICVIIAWAEGVHAAASSAKNKGMSAGNYA